MIFTTALTHSFLQADSGSAAASSPNANSVLDSGRELQLATVIQAIHQVSQSGIYPTEQVLPFLDLAWEAQKLLWKLRQHH